jgi:hypothetical protein
MPENDSFSRDLGYLDKFFDKLEAHAGTLPSEAGQRLRTLIGEERGRWAEIRQLVGATGAAATPAPAQAPQEEREHPYARAYRVGMAQLPTAPVAGASNAGMQAAPERAKMRTGGSSAFTVGSLKPRR